MRAPDAATVSADMSEQPEDLSSSGAGRAKQDDAMGVLSYLLAGLLFYGGLGYLGNLAFGVSWLLPLGLIGGVVLSIYLIIKRFGGVE